MGGPLPCCRPVGIMPLLRLTLLAFSCLFWAAGLAIFTLGVWAQVSLADYMLLSANRYPNAPLILLATGATITAWGFLGCLGVAANLPFVLRAYGFIQLAALMAGLAAGLSGLFYREDIAGGFRSGLQQAVAGYGEDEGRSNALDSLQRALECCGAEGWPFSPMGNGSSVSLPDSCCIEGVAAAGIHPHGCFRKVFSFVNDNVFHILYHLACTRPRTSHLGFCVEEENGGHLFLLCHYFNPRTSCDIPAPFHIHSPSLSPTNNPEVFTV
uniref:Tetraspanin n=1 Tax=Oncorhynchus tshawytscha TaxID=74940 RepID=A0A8C8EJH0_ONCTS